MYQKSIDPKMQKNDDFLCRLKLLKKYALSQLHNYFDFYLSQKAADIQYAATTDLDSHWKIINELLQAC